MTTFIIPSKRCFCKEHLHKKEDCGNWKISLFRDYMVCIKLEYECDFFYYQDEFSIILGYFLLKKYDKEKWEKFLLLHPFFEKYTFNWLWNNILQQSKKFDRCIRCFLKLLGFPYNFDGLMFDFKPSIIELYKQKAIKQRDYYFEGGKKLILNEVPPSRMKKNKFI